MFSQRKELSSQGHRRRNEDLIAGHRRGVDESEMMTSELGIRNEATSTRGIVTVSYRNHSPRLCSKSPSPRPCGETGCGEGISSASSLFARGDFVRSLCSSALILTIFAGCPSTSPNGGQTATQPLRGQKIEILAPKSLNLPVYWEVLLQEWSSQTGASVQFSEFDGENSVPQPQATDSESGGRLVLFPFQRLCEYDSELSPLPTSDSQIDSKDLFKGLRERAVSRDHRIIAFPISVPTLVCYYRLDLLRAANRKPPETWDEYHELIESLETWAPGLVAVEPLGPDIRATTFFAKSLAYCKHPENYSVWFDIDSGAPTLNSPGFVEGLEAARKTWNKLPKEVSTFSSFDCRQQLLIGKAAIALSWEPQSSELVPRNSTESGSTLQRQEGIELGICRLPGSRRVFNRNSKKWDTMPAGTVHAPALCGFAGLAAGVMLPPKSGGETAATNLLISLSGSALFDEAFSVLPKGPCRESQIPLAPSWFGPDLSTEEASQYTDAVAQSLRDPQLVFELPLIGAAEFRRAASEALEPLLKGTATTDETLNTMQKSFEAIVAKLSPESIRNSYRRGLGMSLPPKK